jgi:hypothetical protein
MLNILGRERNANKNHIKISLQSIQNSYHQEHKQQMLVRRQVKKNPYTLLVEM